MNIGVIFGGESCEHDISVITGLQLIDNIDEYLYSIYPIYIDKNGRWLTGGDVLKDADVFLRDPKKLHECALIPNDSNLYIKRKLKLKKYVKLDMVFVCLHGVNGEDGCVAGILEMSKIPYSSSSICGSAVCLDKAVFKSFVRGLGVDVVDSVVVAEFDYVHNKDKVCDDLSVLGFPVIIKPSRLGSSIGIQVCNSEDDIDIFLKNAFKYDNKLLVEKFVDVYKEVNVAIFRNKDNLIVSKTEEPKTNNIILNFDDKYKSGGESFESIKRVMPADISDEESKEIIDIAKKVYHELDLFGIVRFDFIISCDGVIFLNEVNTIPGSMANYLFDKQEYGYKNLINLLIKNALFRHEKQKELIRVFDSGVSYSGFDGLKK